MEGIYWNGGHCRAEQEMALLKETTVGLSRNGDILGALFQASGVRLC